MAAFADPSVRFGLQFDVGESTDETDAKGADTNLTTDKPAVERNVSDHKPQDNSNGPGKQQEAADETEEPVPASDDSGGSSEESDNVVTLDTFRKK